MPGYLVGKVPTAPASSISISPTATLIANNVQSGLEELDKEVTYSATTPDSPNTGDLWIDITIPLEPLIKVYDGSTWILAGSAGDSGFDDFFLGLL